MSSLSAPVATPAAGEGRQLEADQNSAPLVQQLETNVVNPSNPSSVLPRDTSSIPGVSMYARQWYPSTYFKHEEVIANKEVFFEALNKFHTVLGTRLTKKGRKGKERAAEVKTFQESIAGIPPLGGVAIDLHLLYVEVTNRGGLEKVIKDRKWREVTNIFKFPDAVTSGSYMLRKYYVGLLYYFEQAYVFGKQGPLVPPPIWMPGPLKKSVYTAAKTYPFPDGESALQPIRKRKILPMQALPAHDPSFSIGLVAQGAVKGKFEQGYVVTVTVGTETLQGVLYHLPPTQSIPQHAKVSNYVKTIGAEVKASQGDPKAGGSWRKRPRKEEMLKKDPNAPRPNRTGYNFFFAEQCSKFKAMHPDADKELSRIIGHAWNTLTEQEKLPYQEQGIQDKVRYTQELQEYRKRLQSYKTDASVELATTSVQGNVVEEQEGIDDADDGLDDKVINSACNTASESVSDAITEGCSSKALPGQSDRSEQIGENITHQARGNMCKVHHVDGVNMVLQYS
ncbi:hypothetical protein M758_12G048400 [Ceratodon purpureus]|nr:hypothetical protein M758_12G048400 [Ceratodon purpureus]